MISGHNPAISGFAYALSGTFSNNMPTSSCVVLTINTTTWESINWRTAKVIDYIEVPIS
jgi:phosphohistidine phosphatase SixA